MRCAADPRIMHQAKWKAIEKIFTEKSSEFPIHQFRSIGSAIFLLLLSCAGVLAVLPTWKMLNKIERSQSKIH